ncbi:hypothetical protein MUDCAT_44 [Arthrobacter phage Mudcat]|uniref:Uncharacterized protein n=4 Tax=Mudcatvirus TaxID=1982088 RepID=A0A222Z7I9_9CAUD|nr:hypothetical protein BI184_gp44 [Arthrobacter phage Mudcat]YP_009603138.1 hypothetical protein FDH65_gp49 [Arthrobacter phage Circum]YP_010666035.1 hypothetical protein PQB74_gp47 [Arthrobacter phage Arcadia]YP_010666625.1 hypothetical protein PQB80_gp046 [Arthrobacter phage JEGGS]ASR80203.1 hypothetical protein SEA_ELSA_47 [Arthrobacter phage Elsa]ASR80400.1 hypothetical protein SEA_NASON_47 [Arthrobacter phage Nason]ALY08734.1 hypothetical protein CIRCUM_49 [Arthrobacter phage Circum]AM
MADRIPRDPNPDFDLGVKALPIIEEPASNMEFINKALDIASMEYNSLLIKDAQIPRNEFYVVWFSKVLHHWKALVSTDAVQGLYMEVTYNGLKKETYVDSYIKEQNTVYTDAYLATRR